MISEQRRCGNALTPAPSNVRPYCWRAKQEAATSRYAIGKRIEQIDQRIGELYREIAAAEAHTIADVAVKLRRLQVVDHRSRCGQELWIRR